MHLIFVCDCESEIDELFLWEKKLIVIVIIYHIYELIYITWSFILNQ